MVAVVQFQMRFFMIELSDGVKRQEFPEGRHGDHGFQEAQRMHDLQNVFLVFLNGTHHVIELDEVEMRHHPEIIHQDLRDGHGKDALSAFAEPLQIAAERHHRFRLFPQLFIILFQFRDAFPGDLVRRIDEIIHRGQRDVPGFDLGLDLIVRVQVGNDRDEHGQNAEHHVEKAKRYA